MSIITKLKTWASGNEYATSDVNTNFDTIYNEFNGNIDANNIADGAITPAKMASSIGVVPTGAMLDYGGATAPANWLLCDGTAVSRTTYGALFAVIGILFGVGDGSTTFNLPNFKGRGAIGLDVTVPAFDTRGKTGGEINHTPTVAEMAAHGHTQDAHDHTQDAHNHTQNAHQHQSNSTDAVQLGGAYTFTRASGANPQGGAVLAATATNQAATATNQAATATNQNTGGGTAFNVLDPYVICNKIIKT